MTTFVNLIETQPRQPTRWRLFWVLWGIGLLGVFSLLQLPIQLPVGVELPMSLAMIRWIALGQSAVLVALAVILGLFTAPKVGLDAPVLAALLTGRPWRAILRRQWWPALAGALWGAVVILVYTLLQPLIMPQLFAAAQGRELPLLMRVLYGGITEELLLRWGVMSLLVWLIWRIAQRGQGKATIATVWFGNFLAAILFGFGHLPAIASYGVPYTLPLVLGIVIANTLVGLVLGWLYWRKGLEAAILAHAGAHLITVLISMPLLARFMGNV